jgi:hypothetical protein
MAKLRNDVRRATAVSRNPRLADQEAGTKNWRFRGSKSPNLFTVVLNSLIYKDGVPKRSHKDKILSTKKMHYSVENKIP